jgi:hypothetical protein
MRGMGEGYVGARGDAKVAHLEPDRAVEAAESAIHVLMHGCHAEMCERRGYVEYHHVLA